MKKASRNLLTLAVSGLLLLVLGSYKIIPSMEVVLNPTDSSKTINKPKAPDWVPNAVFYEIYPQTFFDTNKDGIGDLQGIIKKLDYVKSLGVNAIWLNPFYESPFRDAGYDISDYYKVAARYGTQEDIKNLFAEAEKRGLKVIVDFVPGHTSMDHPWFKASADAKPNKYSNWYIWTNSTWQDAGDQYKGKMITGFSERDGNYMNNFFWHQPALNFGFGKPEVDKPWQLPTNHPDVIALRNEMKNIMKYWLDLGADGFRIDMAGSIVRNDANGEGSKFWKEVRAMLEKEYPQAFIVAEWSHPKSAIAGGFHSDFFHWIREYEDLFRKESWRSINGNADGKSFFDKDGKGDISQFMTRYMEQYNATKSQGFISIPVGNHDLPRINIQHTDQELEVIYAFLLSMPGVPFMYYGDEIGMRQLYDLPAKEGCYKPRAGARTPMQWTGGKNAGFSEGSEQSLYFAVDKEAGAPNVEAQEKNPSSILNKVRNLIKIRREEKAFAADAEFETLFAEKNKYPFAFIRKSGNEKILVVLNPSGQEATVTLAISTGKKPLLLAGTAATISSKGKETTLKIKGTSYAFYKIRE